MHSSSRKSPAPRASASRRPASPPASSPTDVSPARPRALAKLTRPRLYDALPRPRLFELLDDARTRPIVWICGPPGAGKTTLVASYIEARELPCLWFQVDVADGDPATFVHYIRTAAAQLVGDTAQALPLFNSEPQQDLARFGRGFFRDLFGVLPRPSALVLDNFHEARTSAVQRTALAQGLEEVPEGVNVLVISRGDPPPEFSRLLASGHIGRMDPAALRCTPDESKAMLGAPAASPPAIEQIAQQIDGWAAALVLLREHLSRDGATLDDSLGEGKDAIFEYFAGEIFGGMTPERQRVLMLCAMLPSITSSDAIALARDDKAADVLEDLYRRHLFLDRRRGDVSTFHFHALFREFLLAQAQRRLPSDERRASAIRGAALLAARGQASEALALFRDAREWEPMRELIHANALEWARQGRAQTLSEWIEALPRTMRESDPWLEYWLGRAWIFLQPQRGRPSLARAYAAFKTAGDLRGQALALNTIVTGYYYEWATFLPLDEWLPEFAEVLAPGHAGGLDPDSELRVRAAYVIALLFRRPDHPDLAPCAARLEVLLAGDIEVNARMMAASTLFNYLNWETKGDSAQGLVSRIEPLLADPNVTPLMQVWWRTHLAFWHYINGRYDASTATISDARAIAERYGLQAYLFEFDHAEASALISKGAYPEAKTLVEAIEQRLSPSRRMDWAYFHHLRANLRQRLGEYAAAVQDAERAIAIARDTGLPPPQLPHFLARLAHSRLATGDREGGMAALDEAIVQARGTDRATFEQQRALVEIGFAIDEGDQASAAARLRSVLVEYRARAQVVFLRNRPDLAAQLCDFALEHNIEPDYVRMLIARNALRAPESAGERWPFAIRVRVLGGFELLRDGEPVRFSGKAQQRPLDLLKALVAMGGAEVDTQQITSALWPEADGAAAKTSFDTTLFRLRKLLEVDQAVLLTAGKLSLNPELCWTDVWSLEAALRVAQQSLDRGATSVALTRAATRLLQSYRGNLLGTEEAPWSAKHRDALRARFVRAVLFVGERLEHASDFATAIDLYRRALEADNLSEPLYRGLMRSLAAVGDHAGALTTFRRCRDLLSIVLGLRPGADTERLYRDIEAGKSEPTSLSGTA